MLCLSFNIVRSSATASSVAAAAAAEHWSTDFVTCTVHIKGDAYRNTQLSSPKVNTDEQAGWWSAAGLIRGLSSLDDDRGFKDKFLDGQMEQPIQSEEAQVQLGQHPRVLMVFLSWGCFSVVMGLQQPLMGLLQSVLCLTPLWYGVTAGCNGLQQRVTGYSSVCHGVTASVS